MLSYSIASYFVGVAILVFSLYMAASNIKRLGDDAVRQSFLRLQLFVVALTVVALVVVVVMFHSMPHSQLSLIVLATAVASFFVSSFLHRKAIEKAGPDDHKDAHIGGQ